MVIEIARVNGKIKIEKVTAVMDCGTYVNPDTVITGISECYF
jgi:CO/xanthine dehydrogenase Mo-binding subunit